CLVAFLYYLLCTVFCVFSASPAYFTGTATTALYTLSLHDALPISLALMELALQNWDLSSYHNAFLFPVDRYKSNHGYRTPYAAGDRKSTRLNSSHVSISYAVFCLKKKKKETLKKFEIFFISIQ